MHGEDISGLILTGMDRSVIDVPSTPQSIFPER
jgi:hypothetical protein